MSILRPEKGKVYNPDAAIDQERRRKKEERQTEEERGRVFELVAETGVSRNELRQKRRATAGMRTECNRLRQELQRSPKRGGPRGNPAKIQQKIDDLTTQIREIWPEWGG